MKLLLLMLLLIFVLPTEVALAGQPPGDLKTGTLKRGSDGKLYLDPAQPAAPAEVPPATPAAAPPATPAGVTENPTPATKSGPRSLAVCAKACPYTTIGQAFASAGAGDTVSIAAGLYVEAGVIAADKVKVIGGPGVHLRGVAAEGKAAILVKGSDVVIDGIECSEITVADHNGACVRLEGHNLTLRHVYFHDAEEGILTGAQTGTLTIEDSRLERLGENGLAHAIYAGEMDALIIRRSSILSSRREGHEVKSRAAHTTIENSIVASLDGVDSRSLDIPNGGELVVRDTILEKGLNSSNPEVIGVGLEGIKYSSNSVKLERVTVIIDRKDGRLLNSKVAPSFTEMLVVSAIHPAEVDVKWHANREEAGLAAYPDLPAVAGVARFETNQHVTTRVCPSGCDFSSINEALRQAASGSSVVLGPGYYREGGVLRANHVTLRAEAGARLEGGAVEGKAGLVIKGDDSTIIGLDCAKIEVPDQNGACIRLEGRNLTLRKVNFHDSQEGLLANDNTGSIVIEDSRFEDLGAGGRAHAIYVGKIDQLTLRRSQVLGTTGKGHGVKSRAAHTLIDHSVIASLAGQDSRLVDISNGGDCIIRDSLLEKGPHSDNAEAIGYGLEGMSYSANSLKIENSQIIFDRPDSKIARSTVRGTMSGGRVIGGDSALANQLAGRLGDLVAPGRIGESVDLRSDVKRFPDRAAAGLAAFPDLPAP